jgi:DNA-binding winged helix-turn-helix (wHTH) protein
MHAFATLSGRIGLPPMPIMPIPRMLPIARPDRRGRRPIAFRKFVVLPAARALLRGGVPVEIGGRAFDLLLTLLHARGAVVGKEEIVRQVWPTTFVDQGNLRYQMVMLRKALGADRDLIKTVTGRGYLLIDERDDVAAFG